MIQQSPASSPHLSQRPPGRLRKTLPCSLQSSHRRSLRVIHQTANPWLTPNLRKPPALPNFTPTVSCSNRSDRRMWFRLRKTKSLNSLSNLRSTRQKTGQSHGSRTPRWRMKKMVLVAAQSLTIKTTSLSWLCRAWTMHLFSIWTTLTIEKKETVINSIFKGVRFKFLKVLV